MDVHQGLRDEQIDDFIKCETRRKRLAAAHTAREVQLSRQGKKSIRRRQQQGWNGW